MADFRELSRSSWDGASTSENINSGSLQRIADAMGLMAKRHTELIQERDRFARICQSKMNTIAFLERKLSAAKGQITKLRNAAKQGGETP